MLKFKIRISNGQNVNLTKLRPSALDPDDETQFVSGRDGSPTMVSKQKVKLVNDIYPNLDRFISEILIILCSST